MLLTVGVGVGSRGDLTSAGVGVLVDGAGVGAGVGSLGDSASAGVGVLVGGDGVGVSVAVRVGWPSFWVIDWVCVAVAVGAFCRNWFGIVLAVNGGECQHACEYGDGWHDYTGAGIHDGRLGSWDRVRGSVSKCGSCASLVHERGVIGLVLDRDHEVVRGLPGR